MNIHRIIYKRDDNISLSGRSGGHTTKSARLAEIEKLSENLRSLNQFANAHTLYNRDNKERNKAVLDFAINIPLANPDEIEEGGN